MCFIVTIVFAMIVREVSGTTYVLPGMGQEGEWSCGGSGYDCPSGSNAFGGGGDAEPGESHAYACVDWSVGSMLWQNQECRYAERTGENVTFAVGSYGNTNDEMGKCFRIELTSGTIFIAQIVNTGGDVHNGYFDLQQMGGGIGLCNALTNTTEGFTDGAPDGYARWPMFAGDNGPWGPLM